MEEILRQILNELKEMRSNFSGLKEDVGTLKEGQGRLENEVAGLKKDVVTLKEDTASLKEDVVTLKEDTASLKEDVVTLKEDTASLKENVTTLKEDTACLKNGQDRIETKVDHLTLELRSNFKFTNDKLEEHKKVFDVVAGEIKNAKVDIEFLSGKTGKHDTEINQILSKLRG
ncbi:hypothetical protein [Heyndrickxia acidiproducens]|uniref:hypothetical protein n=1 Tax=Heyndrickxia acidiproducens TaxID=1121084 RepID=UPI00037A1A97|nr:hypothetical protein [Heyndrickxia acidiproducens]